MKNSNKIILSQVISVVLAYFVADYIGASSNSSAFDIGGSAFLSFISFPFVYLFLITLISNFWFQEINKWSYLIPIVLVFTFSLVSSFSSSDYSLYLYWLGAFVGGWVLAQVVNFVTGFFSKKS